MLKYIAILVMLLDHINKILFDNQYFILEFVGRLAFPLFIYLSVSSYMYYTKSKENYIFRILIFSLITTPFHMYGFGLEFFPLNIFFSIALGLIAIYMIEKKYYLFVWVPYAMALYVDYSFYGVLCFVAFYYFLKERNITSFIMLSIALFLLNPYYLNGYLLILSVLIFLDMNYKLNFKSFLNKYVFYAFYPLHIAFLGLLK
jgi:hypothetical protein